MCPLVSSPFLTHPILSLHVLQSFRCLLKKVCFFLLYGLFSRLFDFLVFSLFMFYVSISRLVQSFRVLVSYLTIRFLSSFCFSSSCRIGFSSLYFFAPPLAFSVSRLFVQLPASSCSYAPAVLYPPRFDSEWKAVPIANWRAEGGLPANADITNGLKVWNSARVSCLFRVEWVDLDIVKSDLGRMMTTIMTMRRTPTWTRRPVLTWTSKPLYVLLVRSLSFVSVTVKVKHRRWRLLT